MHDLHVWNLSRGVNPILTAHVHVTPGSSTDVVLKRLEGHVRSIGITHSTIQVCLDGKCGDRCGCMCSWAGVWGQVWCCEGWRLRPCFAACVSVVLLRSAHVLSECWDEAGVWQV